MDKNRERALELIEKWMKEEVEGGSGTSEVTNAKVNDTSRKGSKTERNVRENEDTI